MTPRSAALLNAVVTKEVNTPELMTA